MLYYKYKGGKMEPDHIGFKQIYHCPVLVTKEKNKKIVKKEPEPLVKEVSPFQGILDREMKKFSK